jgi:superfamily II DNA/RNA helicase
MSTSCLLYSPSSPAFVVANSIHPDQVLVCTPQFLSGFGGLKNIPLFVRARTLVMDEADMLLDGHYKRQVEDILMGFRRADKLQDMGIPRTQYVLAAATLPTQGLKSVRGAVTKLFPDATSVTADHMHRQHPAMSQTWMQVGLDLEDKTRQLVDVLRAEDKRRTMVFANTAASCKRAAAAVRDAGIPFAQYHSDVGHMERAQALDDFRDGTVSVLVCTDLASRGLDIPGVTTVIQMEFATNVVQHLHRLGRTARAGKEGRAITFWDSNGAELAKRIQEAGQDGTLDESFSRRRGLRNSVKKAAAGGRGASRREQYRQR